MQMPTSLVDSSRNFSMPHSQQALRALVIEDDPDLNALLTYHLQKEHKFKVEAIYSGAFALDAIATFKPDIIILDVMLPGQMGTDVLRSIRSKAESAALPVILLTARNHESDRVEGLQLGADDYVTKPFSPKELLLRIDALMRRTQKHQLSQSAPIQIGSLVIEPSEHRVLVDGREINLTVIEFSLLIYLAQRLGRLCARDILLKDVWKYASNVNTRTVDTHIKRLRQKLGPAGSLIETLHGFGYKLQKGVGY